MVATAQAIDFTDVKEMSAHNPRRLPAGDYRAKITKVEDAESKQGNKQWVFTIVPTTVAGGGRAAPSYPYYCGFVTDQAWKIRNLCIAAGIPVPSKRVKVDPNKLVNKEIGISLDDDEYEGKAKSTIVGVFPADELAEDAPGASRTKTTTAKRSKAAVADDDDDVAEGDDEELDLEEI